MRRPSPRNHQEYNRLAKTNGVIDEAVDIDIHFVVVVAVSAVLAVLAVADEAGIETSVRRNDFQCCGVFVCVCGSGWVGGCRWVDAVELVLCVVDECVRGYTTVCKSLVVFRL